MVITTEGPLGQNRWTATMGETQPVPLRGIRSSDQEVKGSCPNGNSHSFAQLPYLIQFHTQNLLNEEETSSAGRGGPSHYNKFLQSFCRGSFS